MVSLGGMWGVIVVFPGDIHLHCYAVNKVTWKQFQQSGDKTTRLIVRFGHPRFSPNLVFCSFCQDLIIT